VANQPIAQPYAGQVMAQPQTTPATLPQGPYLGTCKQARMLEGTLTAFCSKGDGSWQTTQLWQANRCTGGVQNAGGDLVCGMPPQVGSSTPPQRYAGSYDSAYGTVAPSQTYAAPLYGYGPPNATYNAYGASPPAPDQYYSPSASRTARPYGY
jgi:hypothetical protein